MASTRSAEQLPDILASLDGRGYKAYKQLTGRWRFEDFLLEIDHVQGDPFADPSRVTVTVDADVAAFPSSAFRTRSRARGTAALLATTFSREGRDRSRRRGSGRSGVIRMEDPGQIVVRQTAVRVDGDGAVEARFVVGLPARGRRISGDQAAELLGEDVPAVVRAALLARAYDPEQVERHAATNEDADVLRDELPSRDLVAFVADGARLPRRSGVDDRPLDTDDVVPFQSPEALRVEVELPNAGMVTGMGLPEGVTLVVGGGFHGKSTVLRAIQDGVYNHPPGDGRELAVSRSDTVKVRAEDGRAVAGVDISPFIDDLPLGRTTRAFTTENASGSTSQASTIMEALEAGAGVLLVDEDTSATNFMIRDRRMQELVPRSGEPITPFIDRVRSLHRDLGVSTVLVLGGSGDYLDVADRVIRMSGYRPEDVTDRARVVADAHPTGRVSEADDAPVLPEARTPVPGSVDPTRGKRSTYVRVPDDRTLLLGRETIDLAAVEQLVHRGQTRAIGLALARMARSLRDGPASLPGILDAMDELIAREGLDALTNRRVGNLVAFRRFELAAALNRLRTLRVE